MQSDLQIPWFSQHQPITKSFRVNNLTSNAKWTSFQQIHLLTSPPPPTPHPQGGAYKFKMIALFYYCIRLFLYSHIILQWCPCISILYSLFHDYLILLLSPRPPTTLDPSPPQSQTTLARPRTQPAGEHGTHHQHSRENNNYK